jgi:BON domain
MKYLFIGLITLIFCSSVTLADEITSSTVRIPPASQPNASTTITTTTTTIPSNIPSPADEAVISAVYDKFSKAPALIGTSLTVTSQNKVVTISGTVTAQSQADAAIDAAAAVVGKENVRPDIKVTTNPGFNKQPAVTPNY